MENDNATLIPSKQIWAILPDDDHVTEVVRALKTEKNILTAHQITCRGVGAVGRGVPGRRLRGRPPKSLRLLTVVVPEDQADDIFDFVFEKAEVDKPMGGIVFMGSLDGATLFSIPEGVQDEE